MGNILSEVAATDIYKDVISIFIRSIAGIPALITKAHPDHNFVDASLLSAQVSTSLPTLFCPDLRLWIYHTPLCMHHLNACAQRDADRAQGHS